MAINNQANIVDPHRLPAAKRVAGSWVVVVTWDEPEAGVCVMGPYKTHLEARFACTENDDWLEQFAVPGEEDDDPMIVTDDVTFTVALCGEPYLI